MIQSSSNRHISTSTVQRRLHESGLHGRIAANKPLLKDTNNKKRLACTKNTINGHSMDIRKVEICPLVWGVQMWDFFASWPRRRVMECCIRWPGLHNHPTSTHLRWFGMSWTAEWSKSSQQVLSNSFKTKKPSGKSWLRECQECVKLSSRVKNWRI